MKAFFKLNKMALPSVLCLTGVVIEKMGIDLFFPSVTYEVFVCLIRFPEIFCVLWLWAPGSVRMNILNRTGG